MTDWDPYDPTGWGVADLHPELYSLSFPPDLPNPYGRPEGLTDDEAAWLDRDDEEPEQ